MRRRQFSLTNPQNLFVWEENPRNKDFEMLSPSNNAWFHSTMESFNLRDKKLVNQFLKTNLVAERKSKSRSRANRMITEPLGGKFEYSRDASTNELDVNSPNFVEKTNSTHVPKRHFKQGEMDLMRKFRYNFNFWLKNCLQQAPAEAETQLRAETPVDLMPDKSSFVVSHQTMSPNQPSSKQSKHSTQRYEKVSIITKSPEPRKYDSNMSFEAVKLNKLKSPISKNKQPIQYRPIQPKLVRSNHTSVRFNNRVVRDDNRRRLFNRGSEMTYSYI